MFNTPILFLIFNRPQLTKEVFKSIRELKPKKLYVAADGPRTNVKGEAELCQSARNEVISTIDWECEVHTLFRDRNLGCKFGVSTAIDWFFAREDMGIILEDDVLPHTSFFPYCAELLEKYKNDNRVGMISGDNFQMGNKHGEGSYYFSRYTHIWGWATWRRAWATYDVEMRNWPALRSNGWLQDYLQDNKVAEYWSGCFDRTYNGEVDTWDYQLSFSLWVQGMHAILPQVNLISNIGFGADATHTFVEGSLSKLPIEQMKFPMIHPNVVERNSAADIYTEVNIFKARPPLETDIIEPEVKPASIVEAEPAQKKEYSPFLETDCPIVFISHNFQEHLYYTLTQAKRLNPDGRILFLSDTKIPRTLDYIEEYNINDYSEGIHELESIYKHHSVNDAWYELVCIKRWFILRNFMRKNNVRRVFHFDSDVLLFCNIYQLLPIFEKYDYSIFECCGHISNFRLEVIEEYCDFIMSFYNGSNKRAVERIEYVVKTFNDNITDMLLFDTFNKSTSKTRFNLSQLQRTAEGPLQFDHNINADSGGYEMEGSLKKFTFIDGAPYCKLLPTDEFVRFLAIHFQGWSKQIMPEFFEKTGNKSVTPLNLSSR